MIPDGVIRKQLVDNLSLITGVLVTDEVVPISKETPNLFINITAQGRSRTAVNKQNYEWLGTVTLSLVKINEKGYISSVELDTLDSQVCTFMDTIAIPGYRVGFSRFFSSDKDKVESPTQTICRKHITYEIWLNRIV